MNDLNKIIATVVVGVVLAFSTTLASPDIAAPDITVVRVR